MKTLQDAWDWYAAATINLKRMQRLGAKHWNDDALKTSAVWQDEQFKQLEAEDIARETGWALTPLGDLGVLVLFSVFEAAVRDSLDEVVRPMAAHLTHPILRQAADDALEGIRQGSFANRVLSPLQDQGRIAPQLADKIKQVRDYRNWVAHGKREPRPPGIINLTAKEAFDRLKEFLHVLGIAVERELISDVDAGDLDADTPPA